MRRSLVLVAFFTALLVGGLWAGKTFAPCSKPMAALVKVGLNVSVECSAPEVVAVDAPREVEPPAVSVVAAKTREFVDRLFVSGTLVAREEAQVAARIDGLAIVELDAEDGDRVTAGQVLARLDRTQLDALLAQNDAAIARADGAIEQSRNLIAQADRKSRDAERRELLVRVGRTEVTAPVSGVVSRRSAKLGATASSAGEPLFRIIADGAIDLEAEVPEQSLARLAIGMPAKLRLPGAMGDVDGTIRLVNQEVDKASRTGKVRIALSDVSHARIGAFASGEVDLARRVGVGAPAAALSRDREGARILVVSEGRVEERRVTPGIVEGDAVEIRDGIADGENIVARAAAFLRPGDHVRAIAQAATPAAGG